MKRGTIVGDRMTFLGKKCIYHPKRMFLPLALKRTKQTLDQRVVNAVESNICVAHLRGKVQIDQV